MPTYEYRCPNDHTFDLFQRMSDEPVARCPECGEEAQRQLSGGAGFLFKGEGFYITDYRSEEYKKKAKAEKGGAGGDGSKEGGSGGSGGEAGTGSAGKKPPSGGSSRAGEGGGGS